MTIKAQTPSIEKVYTFEWYFYQKYEIQPVPNDDRL